MQIYVKSVQYHSLYLFRQADIFSGKTFMAVRQTKALTGLAVFGNAGGYLGLFMGCALMHFPDLFYKFCTWLASCKEVKISERMCNKSKC